MVVDRAYLQQQLQTTQQDAKTFLVQFHRAEGMIQLLEHMLRDTSTSADDSRPDVSDVSQKEDTPRGDT